MIFFVHIPKTAGTSFRLGAESYFGRERIVYDYGKGSPASTPVVVDTLYAEPKISGVSRAPAPNKGLRWWGGMSVLAVSFPSSAQVTR